MSEMRIGEAKNALLDFYPYNDVIERYGEKRFGLNQKDLREISTKLIEVAINDIKGKTGEVVRYAYPMMAIARRGPIEDGPFWPQYDGRILIRLDLLYAPYAGGNDARLDVLYAPCDVHAHIVFLEEEDLEKMADSPFMRLWKWLTSTEEVTK